MCQVLILYKITYCSLFSSFFLRDFPRYFRRVTDKTLPPRDNKGDAFAHHTRGREEKGKADYRRHAAPPPFVPFYPQRPTTSRDSAIDENSGREGNAEIYRKIPGHIKCLRRSNLIVVRPILSPPAILTIPPETPCRWPMHARTHVGHARHARRGLFTRRASRARYRSSLTPNRSETARWFSTLHTTRAFPPPSLPSSSLLDCCPRLRSFRLTPDITLRRVDCLDPSLPLHIALTRR